jgi:hypothetical protein
MRLYRFVAGLMICLAAAPLADAEGSPEGIAGVADLLLSSEPLSVWTEAATAARTFGTASLVSHSLGAYAFTGDAASAAAFAGAGTASRFCAGAPCVFTTPLLLPAGAVATGIVLAACDTSATGSVGVGLFRNVDPEVSLTPLVAGNTGIAGTPGCNLFVAPLAVPETIDNLSNTYSITVSTSGGDSGTRFASVRVLYRLQVSQAPATARFNDVPTNHIFFQFVEALAAAGITGGCSVAPPLYCPDDPVTRGQMAVFIGRALGLHFAP